MIEQNSHVDRLTGGGKYSVGETSCLEGYSGLNSDPMQFRQKITRWTVCVVPQYYPGY